MNHYLNLFSKSDTTCLLDLIQISLDCSEEEKMRHLVIRLRDLLPFDFAVCAHAIVDDVDGTVKSYELINISYPSEWLSVYIKDGYHLIDPIVKENFTTFKLQYWADTYSRYNYPKKFLTLASSFGLRTGYTCGQRNHQRGGGSLFSLSGKSIEHHRRSAAIFELIVPHFHQALTHVIAPQPPMKGTIFLSTREKDVLNWIKEGKSSWDISMILRISERTVNFHVNNIKQKLGAVNRSQAVAVALDLGLIDLN